MAKYCIDSTNINLDKEFIKRFWADKNIENGVRSIQSHNRLLMHVSSETGAISFSRYTPPADNKYITKIKIADFVAIYTKSYPSR